MNKKGEAFIQLIITVAIISILVAALLTFFFNFNSDVEVQKENFTKQWSKIK